MCTWREKRLGDYISINPATLTVAKYNGSIQYIDISSVSVGQLYGYAEYDINDAPSRARRIIQPNDIIFSTVRPNLRAYYYVKECPTNAICSTGFAVLRAKKNANSRFIYYLVTEKSFVDYLSLVAKGSAYPAVDTNDFKKAKVSIPDLPTQQRIADILSTYDDLIENNNKRIALLEKAAQELYKEWFVRFRFPGHESAEFENGLPKGWEVKRLGDYGRIETGKTPSMVVPENYGDEIMFIKTPDMHGNTFVIETEERLSKRGHETQPKKLLPPNSIMVTCIGTGGVVAINAEQGHTNQQINSIVLNDITYLEWLFFTCKTLKETIELFGATGATMTNLSKGKFEKLKVIDPGKSLIESYHKMTADTISLIKSLMYQNQNLAKQRDLLLPRLMSGKLEV